MWQYLELGELGKNDWWRYLISIAIVLFTLVILGYIPTELYMDYGDYSGYSSAEIYEIVDNSDFQAVGLDQNLGLVTMISGFMFALLALFLCVRYLHKKSILHLVNKTKKIRWRHVFFGFAVWGVLSLLMTAGDMLIYTDKYTWNFEWSRFIPLFFVCILLLPFQVAFEEFFVRAYIMQGLYNVWKIPVFAIAGSAAVFALMHSYNPEILAFGWYIMVPYYFGMGFLLAALTVWDRGLEMAFGIHAANNITLALTVSYQDAVLQTDSIWQKTENDIGFVSILIYFVMFLISLYMAYRFIEKGKRKTSELA